MSIRNIELAHELDAAWSIALWLAIHGGDPAPEAVAAQAIAALAPYLNATQSSLSFSQLESQFSNLGIQVSEHAEEAGAHASTAKIAPRSIEPPVYQGYRQYCFQFGGKTICAQLPATAYRETAA